MSESVQIAESINLTTACLEIYRANLETDDFYQALCLTISARYDDESSGGAGDAIR